MMLSGRRMKPFTSAAAQEQTAASIAVAVERMAVRKAGLVTVR